MSFPIQPIGDVPKATIVCNMNGADLQGAFPIHCTVPFAVRSLLVINNSNATLMMTRYRPTANSIDTPGAVMIPPHFSMPIAGWYADEVWITSDLTPFTLTDSLIVYAREDMAALSAASIVGAISISTDGDNLPNPTAPNQLSYVHVYNTTTGQWDRWREPRADAVGPIGVGSVGPLVYDPVSNLSTRMRNPTSDAVAPLGFAGVAPMVFDPVSGLWNRMIQAYNDGLTDDGKIAVLPMVIDPATGLWNRVASATADGIPAAGKPGVLPMTYDATSNTWARWKESRADGVTALGFGGVTPMVFDATLGWSRFRSPVADSQGNVGYPGAANLVFDPVGGVWNRVRQAMADSAAATGFPASATLTYNGPGNAWSRWKEPSADGMSVTGLGAIGPMVFDSAFGWSRLRAPTADGQGPTGYPGASPLVYDPARALWDRLATAYGDGIADDGKPGVLPMVWNGASWDRLIAPSGSGLAPNGMPGVLNMVWNGGTLQWDRVRLPHVDGNVNGLVGSALVAYDSTGVNWNRLGTASAGNVAAQSGTRALLTADPGHWTVTDLQITNVVVSCTKVAGGAGIRHVLKGLVVSLAGGAAATAAAITVTVRDGAIGVGPILFLAHLAIQAAVGASDRIELTGLSLVGTANTAMTVATQAIGLNNVGSMSMMGYSTT